MAARGEIYTALLGHMPKKGGIYTASLFHMAKQWITTPDDYE